MTREQFEEQLERVPSIEGRNVWIWGVGNVALYSQETIKRTGLKICGYCDSDEKKQGRVFEGKPVVAPEHLLGQEDICVLLCIGKESQAAEVAGWLDKHGVQWHLFKEAVLRLHKKEILECYDLLADEASRDAYAAVICFHMEWFGDMPDASCISGNQYFCLPQFNRTAGEKKEVFVDCGAFTGDTIERYLWKQVGAFRKIIAFEPDEKNFRAMARRIERLRSEWGLDEDSIRLHCCGVGNKNESMDFIQGGAAGSRKAGTGMLEYMEGTQVTRIESVALDDFIKEPYSFLKADIEGAEYDMIQGAARGISMYKPLLAICIYHYVADLFQIQLLLHQMVPEYHFAVRHHAAMKTETVLYAYVE